MIEPNIIWLETLVGDFVNILTIYRLYFTRGPRGNLYCVLMETKDEMVHELISLPEEGAIIKWADPPFTFESQHAHMLVRECASTISEWGTGILTNASLKKVSWASLELHLQNNIKALEGVKV